MKVVASTRNAQGSGASRRLRLQGKVPGIIYGGSRQPVAVALDHNPLWHSMRGEGFHSSILDMELDGKPEKVLLRDVQYHAYKQQVMHVDFQRVAADQKITIKVPLHFKNQEVSPAVKLSSAIVSHIINELEVSCLPADLPAFIEVDLSALETGKPVHLSSVVMPNGVTALTGAAADPVLVTATIPVAEAEPEPVAAAAAVVAPVAEKKEEKKDEKK
jgi:large subunit ribosomal protein L25